LLGYYSTNTHLDGRYRRIEVKVARPGTSVAARPGYRSPTAEDYKRWSNPTVASATATRVAEALGRLAAVRPDAELLVEGSAAADGLDIVVELPASAIGDAKWTAGADVDVAATGAAGVRAHETARIEAGRRSVLVHLAAPSASGPWQVRAHVSAGAAAVEGRADVSVAPPSILRVRRLRGTASPRVPARPTVDPEFRRAERLIVEATTPLAVSALDVQVLDRLGQTLKVQGAVAETRRADGTWTVTVLPAAFADGEYALQIVATDAGTREEQYVPFRVVR
jgi:hypothetical protein